MLLLHCVVTFSHKSGVRELQKSNGSFSRSLYGGPAVVEYRAGSLNYVRLFACYQHFSQKRPQASLFVFAGKQSNYLSCRA